MVVGSTMLWLVDAMPTTPSQLARMNTACKILLFFVSLFTILVHLPLEIDGLFSVSYVQVK